MDGVHLCTLQVTTGSDILARHVTTMLFSDLLRCMTRPQEGGASDVDEDDMDADEDEDADEGDDEDDDEDDDGEDMYEVSQWFNDSSCGWVLYPIWGPRLQYRLLAGNAPEPAE